MLVSFIKKHTVILITLTIFAIGLSFAYADDGHASEIIDASHTTITFLWIAVILLVAKFSSLVERFGQPSVLGELVIGVILGNLALLGIYIFEPIKSNTIIQFLAELGVVILLFQIGLESNIQKMRTVGGSAFLVAIVGVIVPFVLGAYVIGPFLLPDLSSSAYLFLGAALTATSVGITARVFRDLGKLHIKEAQIVLGAAVIDDVLGLIILAVVSAIVTLGAVSFGAVGWIVAKAFLFLIGSIIIGQFIAGYLGKIFSGIHAGTGMKFTLAVSFGLILAFLAEQIGLAPIVGAFAAGLILDPVHFKNFENPKIINDISACIDERMDNVCKKRIKHVIEEYSHKHIEDIIEPLGHFFVPIFFVVTGMNVSLATLANGPLLLTALGVTVVAFLGKVISGLVAGNVNKSIVGWGMVPRGEVGLIFATIGSSLGVVSEELFSIIVIMVILTTLFTPPVLTFFLKREDNLLMDHLPKPAH